MLDRKVSVAAIFALLIGANALTVQPGKAEPAAAECIAQPNSTAPGGSRWYYRADQSKGRKCWYLAADKSKARQKEAAQKKLTTPIPLPIARPLSAPPAVDVVENVVDVVDDVANDSPAVPAVVAMAENYVPLAHSFTGGATVRNPADATERDLAQTDGRGDRAVSAAPPQQKMVPVLSAVTTPPAAEQSGDLTFGLSLVLLAAAAALAGIAFLVMLKLSALGSGENPEQVPLVPDDQPASGHRFAPLRAASDREGWRQAWRSRPFFGTRPPKSATADLGTLEPMSGKPDIGGCSQDEADQRVHARLRRAMGA